MKYKYEIGINVDIRKADSDVGEMFNDLEDGFAKSGLAGFRFNAEMRVACLDLTSSRALTNEEIEKMKPLILASFEETLPDYDFGIEYFRRQSSQSCSQST